jgi:phenylacetic acid degradation operon negative regulatory protein
MPVIATIDIDRMLPFLIAVSKVCDIPTVRGYGLEPLDARSLALSVLLGSHPPVLPARALVALAELFGIAGGTMRTALSRMTAAGELEVAEGRYRLAGRLLDRQRAQDVGRRQADHDWDGAWHTVIAADDQRQLADRRRFRSLLADRRFGELRPDIWMRPANLPVPAPAPQWIVTTGPVAGTDPVDLRDGLWDIAALASRGTSLVADIERLRADTDWSDPASIPDVFVASAAVVRYLRDEPLLPPSLTPPHWPAARIRPEYDALERELQTLLRSFLTDRA